MHARRALASVATLLVVASFGCSLLTSWNGFSGSSGPARADGGVEAGCTLARWPDRPTSAAAAGGSATLVGAVQHLRFFDLDGGAAPGLDLDTLCTCPDGPACAVTKRTCDAPGGVDNAGSEILKLLFEEPAIDGELASGADGVVMVVRDYNGAKDDSSVSVAVYNVVGVDGTTDGSRAPRFDGSDKLVVDTASTLTPGTVDPRFFDTAAYVAGGVLVAQLDFDLRVVLPTGDDASPPVEVVVPIKGMRLVADLAAGPKGVELKDATFAGRIPLGTMFSRVGPASSCSDAGIYPALLPNVCAALDLPADPARDGKGDACSALSFAFHVDLVPANVAGSGTSQITPHVPACPPTTGNPCAPP